MPGEVRTSQRAARGQLRRGLGGLAKDFRLELIRDGEISKGWGQGERSLSTETPMWGSKRHLPPYFTSEGKVSIGRC